MSRRSAVYHTRRWKRERTAYIRSHPFCVMCRALGMIRQAFAVDHIVPHNGDPILMWNQDNWQSLCEDHHNRSKQNIEKRGYSKDVGPDGYPIDPNHPANKKFFISGGE